MFKTNITINALVLLQEVAVTCPLATSPPQSVQSVTTEGSESENLSVTKTPSSSSSGTSLNLSQSLDDRVTNTVMETSSGQVSNTVMGNSSVDPPCSSSNASSSVSIGKFILPTKWRPSVMNVIDRQNEGEKRRLLTPDIRNAIVRDLVSSMYAYSSQPRKDFCTTVAKKLVVQYPFMKDVGSSVSGYVSFGPRKNVKHDPLHYHTIYCHSC